MKLRELKQKDAERMLEWMHDKSVVGKLHTDFDSKTMEDCCEFITDSNDGENIHLAITNDDDLYMGTVSLKHITETNAEFAITIHREAMGMGYALRAMHEIINIGCEKHGLQQVYWCVNPENERALRFYDKNGYKRVDISLYRKQFYKIDQNYEDKDIKSFIWYVFERKTVNER